MANAVLTTNTIREMLLSDFNINDKVTIRHKPSGKVYTIGSKNYFDHTLSLKADDGEVIKVSPEKLIGENEYLVEIKS
jgi:hypothetical protein